MIKSTLLILSGILYACAVFSQTTVTYLTSSEAELGNPHDIKLSPDGSYLFVSDVNNNRVAILDSDTLDFVAAFGSDHQSGTHDIDFDRQGRVYVADTHNHRIAIYELNDLNASLTGELKGNIRAPEGVLAHPNGRIYVTGAGSNNVVAYENGDIVAELSGLSSPHDIEVNSEGRIWLSDSGRHRMLLLNEDLEILQTLEGKPYDFNGVRYQDVLADGTVIAADKYSHSIKFIDPQGQLLGVIGNGRAGMGPYQLTTPEGVEFKDDLLWISDSGNNRIVKYKMHLAPVQ